MNKSLLGCSILAATIGLVGCGPKDVAYDKVDRSPYELKVSDLNSLSAKTFLYRRMLGETPRYLTAVLGKVPNNVKLVKLRMTENGIQIVQLDTDNVGDGHSGRFDTDNNYRPILTIGGKYVDYKCAEDSYDKCTNKEQVDSSESLTWDQKHYFVPDFSNVSIAEQDYNDLFSLSCAVQPVKSVLANVPTEQWKGYLLDLKNGVINFELKSTYSVPSISCIPKFSTDWDVDKLSFDTTEYFSLIERDKIVSKDYKAIPYQEDDKSTFGFFTTSHSYRDNEYRSGQAGYKRTYLNRYDPNKKEVNYYLSNNFWDEDNAVFLAAAKEAEAIINTQNSMYHTGLPHINFLQAENKRYGDLRYSFLRLFDQPLDNGLLGIANSSDDPLTGEIISGGFNQFSGNFLGNAAFSYDIFVRDYNLGRLNPTSVKEATGKTYPEPTLQHTKVDGVTDYNHDINTEANATTSAPQAPADIANAIDTAAKPHNQDDWIKEADARLTAALQSGANALPMMKDTMTQVAQQPLKFSDLQDLSEKVNGDISHIQSNQDVIEHANNVLKLYNDRMSYNSEHNILTADAMNLGGNYGVLPKGVKGYAIDWKLPELWVDGVVGGKLKQLKQLPKELRHDMVVKTAAVGFVGTIIHEFGHSIGLRHNFSGSMDYKHFYTEAAIAKQKAALAKLGYPNVTLSTSTSTQMEYMNDMFGMGFGPYDLAAIRFGYSREIQDNRAITIDDWDKADYWHSLKDLDQKRRDEWTHDINNGETRTGSVNLLSKQLDGNVSEQNDNNGYSNFFGWKYCTDGHVDLNSDCNRFDIGFNYDQIAQYYIERYLNLYKLRNTRSDRASYFNTNYIGYIGARKSGFSRMHEFIEDVGGLEKRFNVYDGSLDTWCAGDSSHWYCDRVNAKNRVAKFLLQVVSQPDAVVLINFKKDDGSYVWSEPGVYDLSYLLSKYSDLDLSSLDDADKLQPGQVISQYSDAPKLLDLMAVKAGIKAEYQEKFYQYTPEIKFVGRSLNSSKATVSDPEHPYSNEVDKLGIWPDRLIAMQQLVTRHSGRDTNSLTHQAMVDFAPINRLFKGMLCRMATSDSVGDYNTVMSVFKNDTRTDPEEHCNELAIQQIKDSHPQLPADFDLTTMEGSSTHWKWEGISSVDDFYPAYDDVVNQNIEALDPYVTRSVIGFGFDRNNGVTKGETNLFHALLNQVALYSTDSDTDGKDNARLLREFVGIHLAADYVQGKDYLINGKHYTITDENILALSLLNDMDIMNDKIAALTSSSLTAEQIQPFTSAAQMRIDRDIKALKQLPVIE
ncbi:zinc-dependent metalloprotease [Vibrio rarus]|uniref:zinc-dependent metalloprotease n=1 Tax=Vibrio rarus TaxID=413403 RepID=UPI0021C37BA3|nr:zinc-dependent metalloprotease [Vibrio rarus]